MPDIYVWHFTGHRNQIIGHVGVGELAAFVIHAFLEQRGAKALYYATSDLLIDQLWIDDGAAILDHPMLQQLHKAGIGIDLQPGGLNAIGERKRVFARDKMPDS